MPSMLEITILFATIFTGYSVKFLGERFNRSKLIEEPMNYLTKLIYYILLPVLFVAIFAERGLSLADFSISIVSLLYVFISLIILWVMVREPDPRLKKAFVLTSIFQNTIYLGFPVVMVLYGNIKYAAMYALITMVLHLTVGGILGGSRNILKTILSIPVLYGFIFGNIIHYFFYELYFSLAVVKPFISVIVTYGSAFVMGYALPLDITGLTRYIKPIASISVYRITLSPLIHSVLMLWLNLPIEAFYQILVEAFMPPALTNIIIARIYQWNQELVSTATLVSTFISLAVVFALYWTDILVFPT